MSTTVGKRKNIKHFDEMPHKDFLALMQEACFNDGVIPVRVNMKLDGCLVSFGMDEDGRVWLKSGKSPKVYNYGDFYRYTANKYKEPCWHPTQYEERDAIFKRARCYDNILERLQTTDVGLTPGTYLVGEMFDTYQATHQFGTCKSKTKFVNIWYDNEPFKNSDCTFYVYETNIAQTIDGRRFSFKDPEIYVGEIEIYADIMSIWDMHLDAFKKRSLNFYHQWIARNLKRDIGESIFNRSDLYEAAHQLGACEGIVVSRLNDTSQKQFKIITPSFREMVKKS